MGVELFGVLRILAPFLAMYLIPTLLAQGLFLHSVAYHFIFLNVVRMAALELISVFCLNAIDFPNLVKLARKISPALSFGLALTIKSFLAGIKDFESVSSIYEVWFRGRGKRLQSVRKAWITSKTVTYSAMFRAFQVSEAIYVRRAVFRVTSQEGVRGAIAVNPG
ncbi:MAG: hypothetical protein J7L55_00575, partial [Desulfurococcales archaeon]|nr:hypothetical protein [Desulfurococcales archaeon]